MRIHPRRNKSPIHLEPLVSSLLPCTAFTHLGLATTTFFLSLISVIGNMRSGSRYHHFIGMCQGKESCFYKAAINRSYYAIFHGISAINILDGVDASKHSSVIAYFNQFFVHTGEFNKITYKLIDSAYRIRKKCDYSNFFIASREDSAVQSNNAKMFLNVVKMYLQKKEKKQEN